MLTINMKESRNSTRPALTPKGRLTVQLYRLETLLDDLTEAEQASLVEALTPIVRVARSRVDARQLTRTPPPLVGRVTV